jgi:hypothetical protein
MSHTSVPKPAAPPNPGQFLSDPKGSLQSAYSNPVTGQLGPLASPLSFIFNTAAENALGDSPGTPSNAGPAPDPGQANLAMLAGVLDKEKMMRASSTLLGDNFGNPNVASAGQMLVGH